MGGIRVKTKHGQQVHKARTRVLARLVAAALPVIFLYGATAVAKSGPTCADPNGDGKVTASDALFILRTSVGTSSCEACTCDVDDSGTIVATDALKALSFAVGGSVDLGCPACTTTTSTTVPALLIPCGDPRAGTPNCDGFCSVDGQMCAESSPGVCECIFSPLACGVAAGAPQCWGACAKGTVCVQVGSVCECLP